MIKVKDGYAKLIGTTYSGSDSRVLLSNGGDFGLHTGRNNEANKIVRTDASGYILAGWINTTSGDMGTTAATRIYCSNDGYIRYKTPANFFETLANDGNQISITVGSQNRKLTVNYASFTKTLDNVGLPSSTSNAANTAWCKFARITFNNSAWSTASGYLFFGGGENPDNRAILVYHFRAGNTATTLSTANLHWLVKSYSNATVIAVKAADNVYDLYTNNSGTYMCPRIYHMSAFSSRFAWSVGSWTTTKPTAAYTSSDIGRVYYAESAAQVIVNLHTANNTEYPLVWSNSASTSTTTGNLLYKSYSHLTYNPSGQRITAGLYRATTGHFSSDTTLYVNSASASSIIFRIGGSEKARFALPNGYLGILTSSPSYPLHVAGDSYATGWSRAGNGFYVEGKGVHYMSNNVNGLGQIYLTSNEFNWSASTTTLYFNYRASANGKTVTSYVWNAGSSTTYASHTLGALASRGDLTLYGLTQTCNKANDANYMNSALQIREYNFGGAQADTWAIAPRLSWHWGGRVQTQIGLNSSGDLKLSKDLFATSYLLLHLGNSSVSGGGSSGGSSITVNIGNNSKTLTIPTSLPANGGTSSNVVVNSSDANSTYRMVWHSGNTLYGTGGIYCNPSSDYLYSTSMVASSWFRSTGKTGWYSSDYGGGIYMEDSTWVRTYNSKSFYCSAVIQAGGRIYTGYDSGLTNSISCSNWFRSNGNTGWYNPTNNCHVYPNATTTYGGLMFRGEKGGYTGFILGTSTNYMNLMDNGTDKGLYQEGKGWIVYYNRSNNYVGIRTSTLPDPLTVSGITRVVANSKYLRIGPQNSSHAHYDTDATISHWFNKRVDVNGPIWRYNTNYGIDSDGSFYAKVMYANRDGSSTGGGVSLYSNSDPMTYGIAFRGTGTYGTHGYVTGDWATYLTMSNTENRGWIFRRSGSGNVFSIDCDGHAYANGLVNASRFNSRVATGTLPYACTSTTCNTNLNADLLDGYHVASLFRYYGWNTSSSFADANSTSNIFGMIINQLGNYTSNIKNYPTNYGFMLQFCPGGGTYTGILLYMDSGGSSILIRDRWSSSVWNDWRTLLHNGNSSVSGGGSSWGSSITVKINGTSKTLTIPSNPNTHWTTRIYAGASGTAANAAATNPYLKVTDDNTYRNLVRFVGGGATSVSSDASGNITISSTNTTYSFAAKGSATQGIYLSGTNTFAAMTYSLKATVNAGTTSKLAYYSGNNAISAHTSTVGSSVLPIYLNAGVPTACSVPMVRYWAKYSVVIGSSTAITKIAGNHDFFKYNSTVIPGTGGSGIGHPANFPSGYNINNTIISIIRVSKASTSSENYYTIPTVYMSGDSLIVQTNSNGTFHLHFICIG